MKSLSLDAVFRDSVRLFFLIPDSSVGTAPHLILELVGLQIVM